MPVVTIRMAEGRTLGVDPERVMVFFEELESENIARAGRLLSES